MRCSASRSFAVLFLLQCSGILRAEPVEHAISEPAKPINTGSPMRGNLACVEAENGAREGEPLEDRAARLERQWRLTRMELRMKNWRKSK